MYRLKHAYIYIYVKREKWMHLHQLTSFADIRKKSFPQPQQTCCRCHVQGLWLASARRSWIGAPFKALGRVRDIRTRPPGPSRLEPHGGDFLDPLEPQSLSSTAFQRLDWRRKIPAEPLEASGPFLVPHGPFFKRARSSRQVQATIASDASSHPILQGQQHSFTLQELGIQKSPQMQHIGLVFDRDSSHRHTYREAVVTFESRFVVNEHHLHNVHSPLASGDLVVVPYGALCILSNPQMMSLCILLERYVLLDVIMM